MQELDKVLKNAVRNADKEAIKSKVAGGFDRTNFLRQFNPEFKTIYLRNSKVFGAKVRKEEGVDKRFRSSPVVGRLIRPRVPSDFTKPYLAKLRALLPILKEADDITDKALLNKITAAGIDFKERQSVGNAIYNLVALGNVMIKMNGRARESLTVLRSEL